MVNGYTHGIPTASEDEVGGGAPDAVASEEPCPLDRPVENELAPPDFEAVYAQHFEFVCRSLRLLGVPAEGLEDAAQDVFGVVSRRLPAFVAAASLKTWLFAIVQRVAANHRRTRRRKHGRLEPLPQHLEAQDPSPEAHAEGARAGALVSAFAAGLDDGHRAVLVLALLEHIAAREVAEALGIPLHTVYSRIRSVRAALRAFLAEHEVET